MSKKNTNCQSKKYVGKKTRVFLKGYSKVRFFRWMQRKEALNALLVDHTHLS